MSGKDPHVWENPETETSGKKKKKGLGGLIGKIKDKIKEPSHKTTTTEQQPLSTEGMASTGTNTEERPQESQEVPHDIASRYGAELLNPVQQEFNRQEFKSTLAQASSMGHHLGVGGEMKAEDDPSLQGKNFDIDKSQGMSDKSLKGTIEKARSKEAEMLASERSSGMNSRDFLNTSVGEARKVGERMGTTSPKGERMKESSGEGKFASDFLRANLSEARKMGERMGTTSPKGERMMKSKRTKGKSLSTSGLIEGKFAADYLKSNLSEARKLGERMGTTSPKTSRSSSMGEGKFPGSMAADFLKSNLSEARHLGEKKGTTSPKTTVSHHPSSMKDFTSGFTETNTKEQKTGIDFLKETVSKARELGEKMGTTSPKPGIEYSKSLKGDQNLSQRE